jgi:HD-GYP domain-containing protein (c-di-GMP phosphodiesterase class II)
MFDRLMLAEDLLDVRGACVAPRGFVVSPEAIAEAAQRAPALPRRALDDTPLAADVAHVLVDPALAPLFREAAARDEIARMVRAIALPALLTDELEAARRAALPFYEHALATAAVTARMLVTAVGPARRVHEWAAAALLHDIGMLHVPRRVLDAEGRLAREDAWRIAAHPLLGAYHLASTLGNHSAVAAAAGHHWRCGQGYPGLASPPPRCVEVIAVASVFAALVQPRPFRSGAYSTRAAVDVLVAEAADGHADTNTVKLLVQALRGGTGDFRAVRFGHERPGGVPARNRHAPVSAPARSFV